jgi:hypothetical protein
VKTPEEVRRRLLKLRARYLKKFCTQVCSKRHQNCIYNVEHLHTSSSKDTVPTEVEIAPRIVSTLIVIEPNLPIRLCTYGSERPDLWNGDICDDDETAKKCPYFVAKVSEGQAVDEFNTLMADDDYVLENYKDMATLQWVLSDRVHRMPLSLWDRIILWMGMTKKRQHILTQKSETVQNVDHEDSGE